MQLQCRLNPKRGGAALVEREAAMTESPGCGVAWSISTHSEVNLLVLVVQE